MRVFLSHLAADKPAVKELAEALRAKDFEPWLDDWKIEPGDDIVASINDGLENSQAGIIVFSENTMSSPWVKAEVSYLIYARIKERKPLIPVLLSPDVTVPALIRPLAWRGIEEVDAIADALLNRTTGPKPSRSPSRGRLHEIELGLSHRDGKISATLMVDDQDYGQTQRGPIPTSLNEDALAKFRRGVPAEVTRENLSWNGRNHSDLLSAMGRQLGDYLLSDDANEVMLNLLGPASRVGNTIQFTVTVADPALACLPIETLRLHDGQVLALHPNVVVLRRFADVKTFSWKPLPGPLKILVAVGAPDELKSDHPVLDHEQELQNILNAVEPLRKNQNAQVRILEVGHPEQIAAAINKDSYHVLHLSCHGGPGVLLLENELGEEQIVSAETLIEPIRETGRPIPLIFLNACHGGVAGKETVSLAEALLRQGVPAVLAMQASVSDRYAGELALRFYEFLAAREEMLPSRALAQARRKIERDRLKENERGGSARPAEFATPALYVAKTEPRLADFGAEKEELAQPPVYEMVGPVPQLKVGDLIGRRRQLREGLKILRDSSGSIGGLVLKGIGGIGKSALAGRMMLRLKEEGWVIAAIQGRLDVKNIADELAEALSEHDRERYVEKVKGLTSQDLDDHHRLKRIGGVLATESVLLVLDDFEKNLTTTGEAFQEPQFLEILKRLLQSANKGKLLITCRFPLPGNLAGLKAVDVPPLSDAEGRKLAMRLESFADFDGHDSVLVHRLLGRHPRMLELLDALLRGGEGRFPHVQQKLNMLLADLSVNAENHLGGLSENLQQTLMLGMRDIFLKEIYTLIRCEGRHMALLHVAASNLPVSCEGLARMLADEPGGPIDQDAAAEALKRYAALSLVSLDDHANAWVHRWTAEGLAELEPDVFAACCERAGDYRMWRVRNETPDLNDGIEAVRNYLAAKAFDKAVAVAEYCLGAMIRFQQTLSVAALASEVVEHLPEDHEGFAIIADREAMAFLALGHTEWAFKRYKQLLAKQKSLCRADPDNLNHLRNLSVSYNKMGDLYRALGEGEKAREAYADSLAIAQRLAEREPDRADYQRDLSVSYNKMGDLYRALGEGEKAREAYADCLAIRERLTEREPDRADYQRDLSVSYERMGDLYTALGEGEKAREAYAHSSAIAQRLAKREPDRADYQRDLSVSYNKMGDLFRALGEGEKAREAYAHCLAIRERLAEGEPDRADYQRDLAASYERMGALAIQDQTYKEAIGFFEKALAIRETLARREPNRADLLRELAVPLYRLGLFQLPESTELLQQAHGILLALKEAGKLKPVDEPFLLEIQKVIHRSSNPDQQDSKEENDG